MSQRLCKKCGLTHAAPTGKDCRQQNTPDVQQSTLDKPVDMVSAMQVNLQDMSNRVTIIEQGESNVTPDTLSEAGGPNDATPKSDNVDGTTAASLSTDVKLIRKVKQRLADLGMDSTKTSEDSDDDTHKHPARKRGKKSGRTRTADDILTKNVEWPLYSVYRGSERRPCRVWGTVSPRVHFWIAQDSPVRLNKA